MPIYAYKCESCAHAKDVLQKISDPLLTVCPACGAPTFKKQLTSAGFQLKGSGWYVTDFKGAGAAGPAAKPAEADGKPESGSAAADAKPAESPGAAAAAPATPAAPAAPAASTTGT